MKRGMLPDGLMCAENLKIVVVNSMIGGVP
jgi:hypothetical protein